VLEALLLSALISGTASPGVEGSQAANGPKPMPLGTYHFFSWPSNRAPRALTLSLSLKAVSR
jgi:hypothetical protein